MKEKKSEWSSCPVYNAISELFSNEAIRHLLRAKKEILLAFRSLIDAKLEKLEELSEEKKKAEKIKVE
ncbi:MAG: hypothetical protein QME40_01230 [bacterium]|nr:hypothetical protein [bacterium]